ncbi:hypothetical protein [Brevibacterium oceani]|uniref:hypothetical protein n=1 Tax=Brevibacterium oceani TaxID=358099 RepID=UPI001B31B76C|nr:hypothetical protein [Brevibacterium oceani]
MRTRAPSLTVAPDRQRQGYATETARAMVEWLSEREVTDLPDTLADAGWTTDEP